MVTVTSGSVELGESFGSTQENWQAGESCGDVDEPRIRSLADVVAGCQQDDPTAQRQLYDSCHRLVYRLAVRMVGTQDAADVSQQVFLQVFRSIAQFNGRSGFETWLYRLTVNESLQHLRRAERRKILPLAQEPAVRDDEAHRCDQRDLLEHALLRIDAELRAIFLLREVDGLSYREIAEALDIPEGTVGSRLNRARRDLRCIMRTFLASMLRIR